MAPAGNFECLRAAIEGGADSVYFGVGNLNMRAHSANNFKPEDLKEVTLLHWYQGLTLKEMQKVLRLPRSTVNYRLKKAKAILKKELEDWYFEDE